MKIAYFDCFSGISGNMILGALLDAGLELSTLEEALSGLRVSGYRIVVRKVRKRHIAGTLVEVEIEEKGAERHLGDVLEIIEQSDLPDDVKESCKAIFTRLAEAEARVHGAGVDDIHFHEVGALDAIVDVVGSVAGLRLLGVERIYASPVHVGHGTVECAHGLLPVPAPATLELLRGVPIYGRDVEAELVTPTGAAILTTLAQGFGAAPPMRVERVGYGAGSRDLPLPNLLRVSIGSTAEGIEEYEEDIVTLIETNIDDMNPQLYEHVMGRLFAVGALDVFLTPIQMKRGRPGIQFSVLVREEHVAAVLDILFTETTTIGVRTCQMRRWKLARERVVVETRYGPVRVKIARRGRAVLNIAPEYRDCQRIASDRGVPLKEVYQAALNAARQMDREADGSL